ncbi:MAG: hypothetical protein QXN55_07255, partial [Candidatus Nitrosotenuis sp.]
IPAKTFLEDRSSVDKIIDGLDWKKTSNGILIIDKKAYFLVHKQQEQKKDSFFKEPNFFDDGFASKENFLSTIFENAVAQHLTAKHGYLFLCRTKPQYLEGKEIDVFGEKAGIPKTITVCECKLRFGDSRITYGELDYFHKKIMKIKENESKRGETKFYCMFVSNTDKIDGQAKEFAMKNGIEIRKASLPSDWQERPNWNINEIKKLI